MLIFRWTLFAIKINFSKIHGILNKNNNAEHVEIISSSDSWRLLIVTVGSIYHITYVEKRAAAVWRIAKQFYVNPIYYI